MDVIYATLIIKGLKTMADVPDILKDQVRADLIALGFPELAGDPTTPPTDPTTPTNP